MFNAELTYRAYDGAERLIAGTGPFEYRSIASALEAPFNVVVELISREEADPLTFRLCATHCFPNPLMQNTISVLLCIILC